MIDFLKHKKLYFAISLALLVPSAISLALWRLRPSIDFTGGALVELKFDEKSKCQNPNVKKILHDIDVSLTSVQLSGEGRCLLRSKPIDEGKKEEVVEALREKFGEVEVTRFETVGPILGQELLTKTLIAAVLAAGFILIYVAWQFKDRMYGVCAVLAMLHDTLILLGSFSLLGHFFGVEIDTLFVTAVLTTLSFSVHDTVVVFNSIREQVGSSRRSAVGTHPMAQAGFGSYPPAVRGSGQARADTFGRPREAHGEARHIGQEGPHRAAGRRRRCRRYRPALR